MMDYARHLYLSRGLTGYIHLSASLSVLTEGITLYIEEKDLEKCRKKLQDEQDAKEDAETTEPGNDAPKR
jgi:hypothetical protein